ncbi:MAG: hypothetical protein CMF39_06355 [Legionellaceae bacterium]|nr:hypothetical protein [Legionellaceae bacterium]|tara:strand:- start:912 stop:1106 length:195 start_codon:yes stop_codon:yes gene_type:complete
MCTCNASKQWIKLREFIFDRIDHFAKEQAKPWHGSSAIFGLGFMRMVRFQMDEIEALGKKQERG